MVHAATSAVPDIYTSSPGFGGRTSAATSLAALRRVAEWSDRHGCRGILIFTDNRSADPWVLAHDTIARTSALRPLVAIQPVYMHPYAAAHLVATIAQLYGRGVDLNFVAGGFQFDLAALGDQVPHDARYSRLSEYGTVMRGLLASESFTFRGQFYQVAGLSLNGPLPLELQPRCTVSGSSPAGLQCATALQACAVLYPEPLDTAGKASGSTSAVPTGIRVGVLARPTTDAAWAEARRRFPESAQRRAFQQSVVGVSDSSWLHRLSELAATLEEGRDVYWLGAFRNSHSFCPYLVGAYAEVADYLAAYLDSGVRTIILDCPSEEDDLAHFGEVMKRAVAAVHARRSPEPA